MAQTLYTCGHQATDNESPHIFMEKQFPLVTVCNGPVLCAVPRLNDIFNKHAQAQRMSDTADHP